MTLPARPVIGHSSLRCGDSARKLAIAAGGGPTLRGDDLHVWCVCCGCNMNGYADEPNGVTEACSDDLCLCHDDEWVPA